MILFSKKNAINPETFEKSATSDLKGIIGGAIFAWPRGKELSDDWSLPKLIVLMRSFREKGGLIIGGTLLPAILAVQIGRMKGFGGVR